MTLSGTQISVSAGGSTEEIVRSAVTGSRSQEEILEQLNSIGIEWYVTDQGHLLIRSWRVAAEDFVPIERVDDIRQGRKVPDESDALEWLSANLEDLNREYAGNWIAISDNAVVAASTTLQRLLSLIDERRIQNPFLTRVPEEPIIWETAYANEDL